jgi:uncharacterized protein DUF4277
MYLEEQRVGCECTTSSHHPSNPLAICRARQSILLAGPSQQQVRVGMATVAIILNGLGLTNRRLHLVARVFATKLVEQLLGLGITTEQLQLRCRDSAMEPCRRQQLT